MFTFATGVSGRSASTNGGISAASLLSFTMDCVGFRTGQILAMLSNLIRFQPHRFTDNLVMQLTNLGLSVPLYCLTTGRSLDRDPKRLTSSLYQRSTAVPECGSGDLSCQRLAPSRVLLAIWPDRLQRASLAILAGLYGQYESHRKLIVDEIFGNLVASPVDDPNMPSTNTSVTSDRRTLRSFGYVVHHRHHHVSAATV